MPHDLPTLPPAPKRRDWTEVAAAKYAARNALIPREWRLPDKPEYTNYDFPAYLSDVTGVPARCGILTAEELTITDAPADAILGNVHNGVWTARSVTEAFCKRAAIAQQLVNCLTEICFEDALQRAEELDAIFKETGKPVGPLHGLPVSLKDNFKVKGLDSTVGYIAWCNEPMQEESLLTRILRQTGAVIYCKTNVPTAMMIAETYNNVWGRTLNPYNRRLSPGGSSGGEAALLAMKGSPLGIGTDIGGSIRIPGTCAGLYTLRPSLGRFPTYGARSGMAGQEAIHSVNGPLSRSLSALSTYAAAVVGTEPWHRDHKTLPIPWRTVSLPEKLCFGVIADDGVVRPNPPVRRALDETVAALRATGHSVIDLPPLDHLGGDDLRRQCFLADGGLSIKKVIEEGGEPWPLGLREYGEKGTPHPTTYEMWQIHLARTGWCQKYLAYWAETRERTGTGRAIDGIIMPTAPYAAIRHDRWDYVGYTAVWNVLDWSAATVPVLRADPSKDPADAEYTPRNALDEHAWKEYDPDAYKGGPVSIQVVGKRLEEEKVLALCEVVEGALRIAGHRYEDTFGEAQE
ncbi:amidase signature domain-containing protein [Schizophyllum amplum]|uniref:amidase n=1 Tax=Schizophyllum amplum TaxID=97359 RepID=A0A550CG19_9AGAR|nr:amidase signature domain-containing protein [Auriculariopsis ampla]